MVWKGPEFRHENEGQLSMGVTGLRVRDVVGVEDNQKGPSTAWRGQDEDPRLLQQRSSQARAAPQLARSWAQERLQTPTHYTQLSALPVKWG